MTIAQFRVGILNLAAVFFAVAASPLFAAADEVDRLKEQIIQFQNQAALGIRELTLSRKINGYGSFIPYSTNKIQANKTAFVYFEPINLFTNVSRDGYAFSLSVDWTIIDSAGREILRREKAVEFNNNSRKPVFDLYINMHFSISAPGAYVLQFVVNDELRQESVKTELPVVVE